MHEHFVILAAVDFTGQLHDLGKGFASHTFNWELR
jgi:hypothetical protein